MAYQKLTPLLVFATWVLAGVVQSAESPLSTNQISESRNLGLSSSSWDGGSPPYTVQAGYEGYLVPLESQSIKDIVKNAGISGVIALLGQLLGKVALKVALAVMLVAVLGMLVSFALCKLTTLCLFDFEQRWDRSFSVSQEQMQSVVRFLSNAIDKFGQIDQKSS